MRRPATRLLHVLLSVPVVTAAVIAASPTAHAQARPQPLVVVIDAGHGGVPDPAHPDMPFDPGAVAATNGLMEKDATLAVAKRLRALLQDDSVDAILTRSTDVGLTIQQRSDIANADGAELFISIHFNSFSSTGPNGSLVLYPTASDIPYAQAVSDAMFQFLGPLGVADDGIVLRDNWWIHTRMPTVTVEPAYLSNPREASLVATQGFQQLLAMALRSGLEHFDPHILQRRAAILAWNRAHPDQPVVAQHPVGLHRAVTLPATSEWPGVVVRDVLMLAMLAAVLRWPQNALALARSDIRVVRGGVDKVLVRRAARRRRRRRALSLHTMRVATVPQLTRHHHIYDELC